ncbi:MAG TPA: DUF4350 domain-containing protein [Actinomycetota bacterium]|nr:DUF4350 domain-containing protein [Actinomycetota bacterium]
MKRQWILLGALAALVLAAVALSGPSAGDDRGPHGTLALRRYLAAMGLTVRSADTPPQGPAVFVVLTDLRDARQADDLLSWARGGGTVVVGDPQSETAAAAGVGPKGRVGHYAFGPARLTPGCVVPEVAGVHRLAVDAGDSVLGSDPGGVGCFPVNGGSFEVSTPVGSGRVIVFGGVSPLTNALLGSGDNAAFALGVFGSGGPVVFGPALPPGAAAPKGLIGSIPGPARMVLIQIAIAVVAFALVRGRRFGKPVVDRIPSPVPSGELVHAVARLYRSARARAFAGDALRRATRRRLRSRLGVGPEAGPPEAQGRGPVDEALSLTLAQLSGTRPDEVQRLLAGPPPQTDEELIGLGRELEALRQRVEGSWI